MLTPLSPLPEGEVPGTEDYTLRRRAIETTLLRVLPESIHFENEVVCQLCESLRAEHACPLAGAAGSRHDLGLGPQDDHRGSRRAEPQPESVHTTRRRRANGPFNFSIRFCGRPARPSSTCPRRRWVGTIRRRAPNYLAIALTGHPRLPLGHDVRAQAGRPGASPTRCCSRIWRPR